MSKHILNESTVRKFMKLAKLDKLTDNFVDEAFINEEADWGGNKGDKSKTHPGEEDYTTKKDDELKDTEDHGARGEKKGDDAYVNEETEDFEDMVALEEEEEVEEEFEEEEIEEEPAEEEEIEIEEEPAEEEAELTIEPRHAEAIIELAEMLKGMMPDLGAEEEMGAEEEEMGAEEMEAGEEEMEAGEEEDLMENLVNKVAMRVAKRVKTRK